MLEGVAQPRAARQVGAAPEVGPGVQAVRTEQRYGFEVARTPGLVSLRKLAQDLAAGRKERVTTVHLLAAVAAGESAAGELLRERRLDKEALLKARVARAQERPSSTRARRRW